MKTPMLALFAATLFFGSEGALADHIGYVVCQNSASDEGQDCYDNWNLGGGDFDRQIVAQLVAIRFGTQCVPVRLWPEWLGGCVLDVGDTFEVCKTNTGPCFRYFYNQASELPVVGGSRPNPTGDKIDDKHWIPYPVVALPNFYYEHINCTAGGTPMFAVSVGPSNSVPAFFEIEKKVGSNWVDAYTGYSLCISDQGSGKQFRARALNPDSTSGYRYLTTYGVCDGPID